jgi:hypothetical protein
MMSRPLELLRDRPTGSILNVGSGNVSMWAEFLKGIPSVQYFKIGLSAGAGVEARTHLRKRDAAMLRWMAQGERLSSYMRGKNYLSQMARETYLEVAYPDPGSANKA